jgi:hypothetical protein
MVCGQTGSKNLDGCDLYWDGRGNGPTRREKTTTLPTTADARGKTCTTGTFTNKDADSAWKAAEVQRAEARLGPSGGRQTFQRYAEGEWLSNLPAV